MSACEKSEESVQVATVRFKEGDSYRGRLSWMKREGERIRFALSDVYTKQCDGGEWDHRPTIRGVTLSWTLIQGSEDSEFGRAVISDGGHTMVAMECSRWRWETEGLGVFPPKVIGPL